LVITEKANVMTSKTRQLADTITAFDTSDGSGVKLKRCLSRARQDLLDPFILLDEFATDNVADYIGGFPEHPHRGFETVTYMLAGSMRHRDHLGNEGHLKPGSVQWMTAAHGIIHSEMPEQEQGLLHGFQLWINLPASEKMKPPHYQEFGAEMIPIVPLANDGYVKVIAGEFVSDSGKVSGPVMGVATQPLYFDVLLTKGQGIHIPVDAQQTVLIYVYEGDLNVGGPDNSLMTGQLGLLTPGTDIELKTRDYDSRFLVLAARPIREPVVQSGPFVMNTHEEIEQAFRDYRNGTLTL
jgi:redox-sensitive bicupin YhaK (pirin superfamily)